MDPIIFGDVAERFNNSFQLFFEEKKITRVSDIKSRNGPNAR